MIKLLFFHGLNTFGDDLVHVGPLTLGAMHARWQERISARYPQIEFIPILDLSSGTVEEQTARVLSTVHEIANEAKDETVHFLGQSTGGLVARALAHHPDLRTRIKTVITIGTPHHGSGAASFAMRLPNRAPLLSRLIKSAGYDLQKKLRIFATLTPEALADFNRKFTHADAAPCISLICELPRAQVAWPLQVFYGPIHPRGGAASDGFITGASQQYVTSHVSIPESATDAFRLDHYGELGLFLHPRARVRAEAAQEFDRLVDVTAQIVSSRSA